MSFSIVYNPEQDRRYPMHKAKKGKKRIYVVALAVAAGVLLFGRVFMTNSNEGGVQMVKCSKFDQMVEDIRQGASVSDAFTTFCLDVLKNAEIY